jgi:hypothetical protein
MLIDVLIKGCECLKEGLKDLHMCNLFETFLIKKRIEAYNNCDLSYLRKHDFVLLEAYFLQ